MSMGEAPWMYYLSTMLCFVNSCEFIICDTAPKLLLIMMWNVTVHNHYILCIISEIDIALMYHSPSMQGG